MIKDQVSRALGQYTLISDFIGHAQEFEANIEHPNIPKQIFMQGIDRVKNIKVGDTGYMFYVVDGSRGHYSFRRD